MTTTAIGQLLVSQMHRDILKHLLRLAPISVFRTIGRINRHCRSMTSALSMFWPRPMWFTAWKPSMSWFNGPTRLAVSTAWIPFSQKFISAGLIPAWRPSLALLGSLFTDMAHRDVLSHLLRVARPGVFGAIAQLNRHCAEVARSLKSAKQERWLSLPVSTDMPNRWFMYNGRLHGQQTRRCRECEQPQLYTHIAMSL